MVDLINIYFDWIGSFFVELRNTLGIEQSIEIMSRQILENQ